MFIIFLGGGGDGGASGQIRFLWGLSSDRGMLLPGTQGNGYPVRRAV